MVVHDKLGIVNDVFLLMALMQTPSVIVLATIRLRSTIKQIRVRHSPDPKMATLHVLECILNAISLLALKGFVSDLYPHQNWDLYTAIVRVFKFIHTTSNQIDKEWVTNT